MLARREMGKEEWVLKYRREILHPETLERVITLNKILLTSVSEELVDSREILKGHLSTERHLLGTLQGSY